MNAPTGLDPDEFRHALRHTMNAVTPPAPMNPEAMVQRARRAQQRRRTTLASTATAVAVAAVAAGAVVVINGHNAAVSPGSAGHQLRPTGPQVTPTGSPGTDTKPNWPNGQTDATASSGPRFDQGAALLDAAARVAPDGYDTANVTAPGYSGPLRNHQTQVVLDDGQQHVTGWEYQARVPLTKSGKTGMLMVVVTTGQPKQDPCAVATGFWGMGGQCQIVHTSGGAAAGVVAGGSSDDRYDQWAAYQYPDGTAVVVVQAKEVSMAGLPALLSDPYTVGQLAELATTPDFHVH